MALDETVRRALSRYLSDIRQLANESAKTHRFSAVISELFPGSKAPTEFAAGIEKLVRIDIAAGSTKRGFVDAYYGNAVIEFENSLKATESDALAQIREYTSALWNTEGKKRQLICIASDGLVWKTYRPTIKAAGKEKLTSDDVELQELRTLTLSEETLPDFWIWLTSLLFRPSRAEPTAERFRIDFGGTSPAFADALEALIRAWETTSKTSEARLAFDTWQRYLTVTYGHLADQRSEDLIRLFLKHTYLASLARLLIWAALSEGKTTTTLRETAKEILSGRFFEEHRIENLVEDDFFQWVRRPNAEAILAPIWERTLSQLETYDLVHLNQDVLKGVYQELVDPKDRHDLGEYYTPEWLCERIVSELLPAKGFVSVLDPSCGSGSFLRAAIAHLLGANPSGGDATRLRQILDSVVGIDIHPLAVIISRATYLLALRTMVKSTKRPIQIPVYLADSLFLPTEVKQMLLGEMPGFEIRFGGNRRVSIPEKFVKHPEFFDPAIHSAARIAVDHAASGKETKKTLHAYLEKAVPDLCAHEDADAIVRSLWKFTEELSDLVKRKENSIWAFIVRNSYRPAMLRDRFDYILGNPPWLSYRYIADPEYQAEIKKRSVDDYMIAPRSQKLTTQMELATIFLVHTLTTFARVGGKLGFVMPLSVLSADQHQNLRTRQYKAPVSVTSYWDLRAVRPLFNVPSCVLFAAKGERYPQPTITYALPTKEWSGVLPRRDLSWNEASTLLISGDAISHLIYLGERNALSTKKGKRAPSNPSQYVTRFKDGATLYPRNFYFVNVKGLAEGIDPDGVYWAETDPDQAANAKVPYKGLILSGAVEGQFIYSTALARNVLPFALLDPAVIVLPLIQRQGQLVMRTPDQLREDGFREMAKWMELVETIWKQKRERKAKQTATQWLDYQGKLTAQKLSTRNLVLYNASGTDMCATRVDRTELRYAFLVDHKLYWAECDSPEEAHYLTAILNSQEVNERIKPFQSVGIFGERDIHKKVLDLPIPTYDEKRKLHRTLAGLGQRADHEARASLSGAITSASLGRRRGLGRKAMLDTLSEINSFVKVLLG